MLTCKATVVQKSPEVAVHHRKRADVQKSRLAKRLPAKQLRAKQPKRKTFACELCEATTRLLALLPTHRTSCCESKTLIHFLPAHT